MSRRQLRDAAWDAFDWLLFGAALALFAYYVVR
jgi:hypothetical protein